VQLVELQTEDLPGGHDHVGEQGASVGVEEMVQRSPDGVVADVADFLGLEPERGWDEAAHDLVLTVDGLPLDEHGP